MKTAAKIVLALLGALAVIRLLQVWGDTCSQKLDRRYISREIDLND